MGQNKKKQHQLRRMFTRQDGRCAWCNCEMLPPGSHRGKKGPIDRRLCTLDHFDDRLSDERGKHGGEYRNVAACWECNNNRNAMQQANVSKKALWERSGAYPRDIRDFEPPPMVGEYYADYTAPLQDEIHATDPQLDDLLKNSRPVGKQRSR